MADHEPPNSGTKYCPKCNQDKSVLAFSVERKNRDGLRNECRECSRADKAASRSYRQLRAVEAEKRTRKLQTAYSLTRWT